MAYKRNASLDFPEQCVDNILEYFGKRKVVVMPFKGSVRDKVQAARHGSGDYMHFLSFFSDKPGLKGVTWKLENTDENPLAVHYCSQIVEKLGPAQVIMQNKYRVIQEEADFLIDN